MSIAHQVVPAGGAGRDERTPTAPIRWHPYSEIFPWIEGRAFDELVEDIRKNGVLEPIVMLDGAILDGRNRYMAARQLGIEYPVQEYQGSDPLAFVLAKNLARRHLTESQRAMVANRLAKLPRGANQHTAIAVSSQEDASALLNVSADSIQRARKVEEQGSPELIAAVDAGDVSVSAAADVATLPKDEQAEIVALGDKEIVKRANRIKRERKAKKRETRKAAVAAKAAAVAPAAERYEVYNEDCAAALEWEPGTVDLIITDPPYSEEHLPLYDTLGELAAHVLRPGGSLLCMVGHTYLPDYFVSLSGALNYHWTLAYLLPGGQAVQVFPRKVNTFWKPVLWFVKGEYDGEWIGDVSRSAPNDNDKRFHEWGQSESGFRDLMSRFVKPGDVVLDPFMGAGTTGVIALELGAQFFGFDTDKDAFNEALVRMGDAKLVA